MLASPPLKELPHYPVTAGVAVAAIIVTGLWWSGQSIDAVIMSGEVWSKWELWRGLTCTLPHVSIFHLAFNLYWLWKFGSLVERVFGHLKCAGIYVLLGLGSSLAEFSVLAGGVGLSGIGYGLWGMLWVLERRDGRFAGAVDQLTSQTFVIWFFLCIILTVTDVMPVGNVAHGAGAVLGALLGHAISSEGGARMKGIAGLVTILILGLAGSTIWWPRVNLSEFGEAEVERAGLAELDSNPTNAMRLLETSTRMRHVPARAWYNLGIAYQRSSLNSQALAAYQQAARMPDSDSRMQQTARDMKKYMDGLKEVQRWWGQAPVTNSALMIPMLETNR